MTDEALPAITGATFTQADDQVVACRAWGHEWPSRKLRPGRPLPKGYVPRLADDGYVEISESCMNGCGKKRRWALLPGGVYDLDMRRTYTNPENWPVYGRGTGVTRRHFQGEAVRRVAEDIMEAARNEAARTGHAREAGTAGTRGRSASGAPAAIFRGITEEEESG